jgi:hypothetical protein
MQLKEVPIISFKKKRLRGGTNTSTEKQKNKERHANE